VFTLLKTIRIPPSRGLLTKAAGDSGYLLITAGEQNIKKVLTQRASGSDLPAIPALYAALLLLSRGSQNLQNAPDCIALQLVTARSVTKLSPDPPPQRGREGGRGERER
jgi:hypothetical protein